MDPKTSSQDVRRCDLCETALVKMHCNTCLIKLCKACVGEHISTDECKDHNVVNFQDINSTPLYPECAIHIKERCEMYCKHCDIPVCPTCLASDQHFCHKLSKILQVRDEMKELIRKQQYELNEKIYPTYQGIAARVQFKRSQLEKGYEDLLTTITEHEVYRHKKIEEFVRKLKSQVNIIKTSQLQTLQKHLDEINKKIVDIKADIDALDNAADSDEISTPVLVRSNIALYKKLPQELVLSVPKFTPTKWIDFSKMFGALSPISLESEEYGFSLKTTQKSPHQKPIELGCQHPVKKLLEQPLMSREKRLFDLGILQNVAWLENGAFWTSGKSSTMTIFSISSDRILKQVITKSGNSPTDIAVSKSGDLIYTDYWDRTVNVVKNNDIEEVVKVQNWRPQCACSTSFGDLLVILDSDDNKQSKVAQYFGSTERLSIQIDDEGKPLYSSGGSHKYIIENRNLDICVADSGAKAVVVVNLEGKLRFRYTGHSSAQKNKSFSPGGITTDSMGQILTIDNTDNIPFIHIINEDGQFLRHINCGRPYQLYCWCIDTDDYLFLFHHRKSGFIFSSSFVSELQYLK